MIYRDADDAQVARIASLRQEIVELERRRAEHRLGGVRALVRRERRRLAFRQHPVGRLIPRSFTAAAVAAGVAWTLLAVASGVAFLFVVLTS